MKKYLYVLLLATPILFLTSILADAASVFDIQFPIATLGNCGSQQECKQFCDNPDNKSVCLSWAQENGFAPRPDLREGRDMNRNGEGGGGRGPGSYRPLT